MSTRVNPTARSNWSRDWKVGVRIWIEREGQAVLGAGRAELLAAVDTEHSITKAAKVAGMSYRRAWSMIQDVNAAAGEPLVEAAVGGKQGGGARLTPKGRVAIAIYESVRQSLTETAAGALQRSLNADTKGTNCIHLAAAISLQEAVGQILTEFAVREPVLRVRAIFGASNELADQVRAGSPADIFLSADIAALDRLERADLLHAKSLRTIAKNGLAIISHANSAPIKSPKELLASRFKRVVLAEAACPLGQYAKDYLTKAGLYDEVSRKALCVDNSRAVLAAVASGAADAGVAFASDAAGHGNWRLILRVPTSQVATTYTAALIRREHSQDGVERLLDYLTSPAANRCYRRCGLGTTRTLKAARKKPHLGRAESAAPSKSVGPERL
jgi:molybdate transport system substrate-binding protein